MFKNKVKSLFILLCIVAFISVLSFFHINSYYADSHNLNWLFWLIGIVGAAIAALLVILLLATNKK